MLVLDPPEHTRYYRLVGKVFTPGAVAALRPRIQAIADELLDRSAGQEVVDLVDAYTLPAGPGRRTSTRLLRGWDELPVRTAPGCHLSSAAGTRAGRSRCQAMPYVVSRATWSCTVRVAPSPLRKTNSTRNPCS